MNVELKNLNILFCAKKILLSSNKTNYVWFHTTKSKDKLPLVFPDLCVSNAKNQTKEISEILRVND